MDYRTILSQLGYTLQDSCTCTGTFEEKYAHRQKPEYRVHVAPNANWFQIYRNGQQSTGKITLNNLNDHIAQI